MNDYSTKLPSIRPIIGRKGLLSYLRGGCGVELEILQMSPEEVHPDL